jgi:hypothetical protein
MSCAHCNDTGSLSKELHGILDCGHCDVATERTVFANWAREVVRENDPIVCLWLAHQRGRAAAAGQR